MHTLRRLLPVALGAAFTIGVLAILYAQTTLAAPLTRTVTLTQTSIDDFNRGSFYQTGMTRLDDGEVTLLRLGIAGAWLTNTNAAGFIPRFEHASIAYRNRLYVFGGRTGLGTIRSIQSAAVDTETHNLSNWITSTVTLSTDIYTYTQSNAGVKGLSAAVLNGRVYLLGGDDGLLQHYYATVAVADIDLDTGELGSLTATTPLPEPLSDGQVLVLGNRLYYVGGRSPGSPPNSNQGSNEVYYAEPDPATGLITTWYTASGLLPYKTYNQMSVATVNDRIYSMAGVSVTTVGGGIVPDVYYAQPLTATGDITGWIATNAMPRNIFAGAAVSFGGQIYAVGGALDGISDASNLVFSAIDRLGGGVNSWPGSSAVTPPRLLHTAVINDDGWIYVIGGSTGTNQPIQNHIVNAGATTGEGGSAYMDDGVYTSDPFDLEKNFPLTQLSWSVNLPDPAQITATLRYRYRLDGGAYTDWSPPYPAQFATGVSTSTLPLAITARYVQYQVNFATTDNTVSPILTQVSVQYLTPEPPEFLKVANPPSGSGVSEGEQIVYTLTYKNVADITLHHTFITDVVPARVTYVPGSIFASAGVTLHTESAPDLYWEIGPLPPQGSGTLGFAVTVNTGLKFGDIIRNLATFDSDEVIVRSPTVIHTVGAAYKLTKSHVTSAPGQTRGRVQPGDLITYTLTYTNPIISVPMSSATITDQVPVSTTFVQSLTGPAPDPTLLAQGILNWSLGDVPTNTSQSVQYVVQVLTDTLKVPDGGEIVSAAELGGTALRTISSNFDPVPIRYRFDLKLDMTVNRVKAQPGDVLTYTLVLTNVTALPITVTDTNVYAYLEPGLPGLTQAGVVSCMAPCTGWTFLENDVDGNTVYAALMPALGPQQSTTLTLVAQISPTLLSEAPDVLAVANFAYAIAGDAHGVEVDPSNQSQENRTLVAGPDVKINTLSVPPGQLTVRTPVVVQVTVANDGFDPTMASDGTGWFGVDVYVKPVGYSAPASPSDRYLGGCPTFTFNCPTTFRPDYYREVKFYTTTPGAGGLGVGETWAVTYTLPITKAGTYWIYAQADTYGSPYSLTNGNATHGRIVEGDEQNNIFGPVIVQVGSGDIYLPLIVRLGH